MPNEEGSLWLTYNGEIYNFKELRTDLTAKGHQFRSRTDSEVLLHLYEDYGPEMLSRLNGIFAFAIWDELKRELFLARDALGVKPLYFSETSKGFLFSSEIKALLQSDSVSREIFSEAVQEYLTFMWSTSPKTMLKNVSKLPPGHFLIVSNGKILRGKKWYSIPYRGIRFNEREEVISEKLAHAVRKAVERQLVSDVPVGAFLSGGLDSSAVVAMMRQALGHSDISCYCIGFEESSDTEGCPPDLPYARKVAKHLGVKLNEIIVKPEQLIRKLPEMIYFLDEPQSDPAPVNAMFIAERARSEGIKVLLTGTGGDDIFSGYRRHFALKFDPFLEFIPKSWRKKIARLARRVGDERSAWVRRLKKFFVDIDKDAEERLVSFFKWSPDDLRKSIMNPGFFSKTSCTTPEFSLIESLREIPDEPSTLNRMLFLDSKHFLTDHNLNYTDKTTMRYAVETRVPLLDLDLVEFATKIPPDFKQKGRIGKAVFKKSMEKFLPTEVIYREKTGFGAPLRKWIREDLREMIGDFLSPRAVKSRGIFDPEGVRKLIEADREGKVDGAYTIFSVLCIELWCRLFLDRIPFQNITL